MKNHCSLCIWIVTIVLHGIIYFLGMPLAMLGAASLYIIGMLFVLILKEIQKRPIVEFEKLVFICILHIILLSFDLFAFLFLLSLETGNFHSG